MLTSEQIPVIHDLPAGPFKRFVGFKTFQRTLDAKEEFLIEIRHGFVCLPQRHVDLF